MGHPGTAGSPPGSARMILAGTGAIREMIPGRAESGEWKGARSFTGNKGSSLKMRPCLKDLPLPEPS